MTRDEFRSCLTLYGAKLERWPDALRHSAFSAATRDAMLARLISEERAFEAMLALRETPEAADGFCERIIAAAPHRPAAPPRPAFSIMAFLRDVLGETAMPSPAFTLGGLMLIGLALGAAVDGWPQTYAALTPLHDLFSVQEAVL